jgi:hypothetical protein
MNKWLSKSRGSMHAIMRGQTEARTTPTTRQENVIKAASIISTKETDYFATRLSSCTNHMAAVRRANEPATRHEICAQPI